MDDQRLATELDIKLPIEMIAHWAEQRPDDPYMHQPVDGQLRIYTFADVHDKVLRLAAGLKTLGLAQGDRVAILSKNCAEWCIADLAIQAAGFVVVPIYPTAAADTVKAILEHSESKAIFVGKLDDPAALAPGVPDNLIRVALPYDTMPASLTYDQLISDNTPLDEPARPEPEELMTLVYTSGSTGQPKGVMLSYRSYAGTAISTAQHFDMGAHGRLLSHLPLAHIADRSVNLGVSIFSGCKLFFAESLETFQRDMQRASPTHFATVPRLWMKFQASILEQIPQKRLDMLLRVPGVRGLVKKKLRDALGLTDAVQFGSGAAPISPAVIDWFAKLDIHIVQGYGMSETSGLATTHWPLDTRYNHTVGRNIRGFEVQLDDNGEVLISGVGLFSGYYKEPELTAEVFDGTWIRSGDKGHINDDGYLQITGRAKEIFKTAKAKYVAPVPIEALLAENTDMEQICVMGAGLVQPVAVVVLSAGAKRKPRAEVSEGIEQTIKSVNGRLEPHDRIGGILIAQDDWTVDNGLLTPTMKIKRGPIEQRYGAQLADLGRSVVTWEDGRS